MSTRRERANRWWLRCRNCGAWKVAHLDPWTKTYICNPTPCAGQTESET